MNMLFKIIARVLTWKMVKLMLSNSAAFDVIPKGRNYLIHMKLYIMASFCYDVKRFTIFQSQHTGYGAYTQLPMDGWTQNPESDSIYRQLKDSSEAIASPCQQRTNNFKCTLSISDIKVFEHFIPHRLFYFNFSKSYKELIILT